jgi:hypothetical protein
MIKKERLDRRVSAGMDCGLAMMFKLPVSETSKANVTKLATACLHDRTKELDVCRV